MSDRSPPLSPAFGFVYLASQSPRRRELLDQLGVRHTPLLAGPDEDAEALEAEVPGETAVTYVERVTSAKLHAARARLLQRGLADAPVLCADTTVALGRRLLGKPADAAAARATLRALSGRWHRVLTAVAVTADGRDLLRTSVTRVCFAALTDLQIDAYIDSREPFGKAGAYAIQGAAAAWISRIDGSPSGVMGLPLYETSALLRQARVRFATA